MIEKVNPGHPDKVADRIAGAMVDLAYKIQKDPFAFENDAGELGRPHIWNGLGTDG